MERTNKIADVVFSPFGQSLRGVESTCKARSIAGSSKTPKGYPIVSRCQHTIFSEMTKSTAMTCYLLGLSQLFEIDKNSQKR